MEEKDLKDEETPEESEGAVEEKAAEAVDDCAELKDKLLRKAAEFENYKKRVAKEIAGSKDAGRSEVISRLLQVVDEFELAMDALGKDDKHAKGIELIYSNLMSGLKSFGLQEIEATGKFDPYKHEIMLNKESEKPDGEILEVVRKGYMINNVMIRPASVIVSKHGAGKQEQK